MCAGRTAGGGLYLPIGLFAVAMSPRNAGHKPIQLTNAGMNMISDQYLSSRVHINREGCPPWFPLVKS